MGEGGRSIVRTIVICIVIVLVLGGGAVGAVWWLGQPKPNAIVLDLGGTNGVEVEGTAEVDGVSQELKGKVPTQFQLQGRRVVYTFTTKAEAGEFRIHTTLGSTALGSAGSLSPPKYGVRGWVQSDWGWDPPRSWIESFAPGDKWGKAPP